MRVLLAVRADKRTFGGAHSAPSSGPLPVRPGRCAAVPPPAVPAARRCRSPAAAGLCPRPHQHYELPRTAKSQYEDFVTRKKI